MPAVSFGISLSEPLSDLWQVSRKAAPTNPHKKAPRLQCRVEGLPLCVCALCSTTTIPSEDGCETAYLLAVLDRQKAQPAAARVARFNTRKDEYPRLIQECESCLFVVWVCGPGLHLWPSGSDYAGRDNENGRALLWFLLFYAHARIVGNPAWVEAPGQGRGAPRSARLSLDAEMARPILAEPGWRSGTLFGKNSLSLTKAHCGPKHHAHNPENPLGHIGSPSGLNPFG